MEKIVSLHGRPVVLENGAESSVIELLEGLLKEASQGEIKAIAVISVMDNGKIRTQSKNPSRNRHLLVAGTIYLNRDLAEESEEVTE